MPQVMRQRSMVSAQLSKTKKELTMNSDAFRNQVVIVTGASSGIGKSLAIQLAGQGAKVVIAARRADRLEDVAAECKFRGGEALVIPTDVSDEAQCKISSRKQLRHLAGWICSSTTRGWLYLPGWRIIPILTFSNMP